MLETPLLKLVKSPVPVSAAVPISFLGVVYTNKALCWKESKRVEESFVPNQK